MHAIEDDLFFATQALLNTCVTLNEFPLIRYYNPSHPALGPLAPVGANQGTMNSAYGGSARMARLGGIPPASSSTGEHFTKKLALRLQEAIDGYVRDNQPKQEPGRPRGVLFITDRTMDPMAPFLHEFSYQAMANDLLPIEDGTRYHYRFYTSDGQQEDKDATLSDEDAVWTGIRHLHIAEAIDKLTKDFQAHAGEAGAFANEGSSLNDMRDMLASLPHMQEMKDKLSLHLTMAQDCMSRFEKTRLPQQAMVEQNCATRLTPEGQKPRTLVEEMVPLLDDRGVSNADKVRIIALYIMYCEGVNDEDRKRLFQHARLGLHEMDAVNNLVHLGVQVVKDPSQSSAWDGWLRNKGKRRQQPTGENEYELSRYQPLLKLMIEDHFAGKLDQTTYPYVRDAPPETASATPSYLPGALANTGRDSPLARVGLGGGSSASSSASGRPAGAPSSLRSAKPTWHQKERPRAGGGAGSYGADGRSASSVRNETRQRVMVFVAGGMTYSEVRSIYQLSNKFNKDGYIGSSHIFTPESYIEALKQFGKAGNVLGGSAIGPGPRANGYNAGGNGHTPYNGQSKLSPAANEVSGLMSKANKVLRSSSGEHQQQQRQYSKSYEQQQQQQQPYPSSTSTMTSSYDQGKYDRRFGTASSQSNGYGNGYGNGAEGGHLSPTSPTGAGGLFPAQQPSNGGHGDGAPAGGRATPHTFSGATGSAYAQQAQRQGGVGGAGAGAGTDPYASSMTGGSSSMGGAKRKMKNVFAFRKS